MLHRPQQGPPGSRAHSAAEKALQHLRARPGRIAVLAVEGRDGWAAQHLQSLQVGLPEAAAAAGHACGGGGEDLHEVRDSTAGGRILSVRQERGQAQRHLQRLRHQKHIGEQAAEATAAAAAAVKLPPAEHARGLLYMHPGAKQNHLRGACLQRRAPCSADLLCQTINETPGSR